MKNTFKNVHIVTSMN